MKNTYEQGEAFETLSYNLVQEALNNFKFGLLPSCCKVFKKQPYYSATREKNIVFDISLEVWPEGAERRTLLYLIECKDYRTHKVPIDDVEEFWAKASQVSDMGVKPVMITTSTFQRGAYIFAKNKGIMLIEVDEKLNTNPINLLL
ncbi:restriction endonuclease [Pedobacter cryoconitis]|uniref:Restriction endonuclease n=1 Tax=Pedobacter cryoconitis TaxID=188932 RepID=A0A327SBU0_9SPHI|nr:restriction endonuclease [Pedobacter cryoconitis]RAJ26401.1 restriction endonuclease [Pedobacter cryoconitis]